ncbi:MAG: hypothetical protein H6Q42_3401 [Deltaproteobacteria bacterium]|jgi:hypothetical protein|nr:hypothetical protein [Deltaproteobacteria bacterium]
MGRTVMPFSFVLEKERGRWKEVCKGLNKEDPEPLTVFAIGPNSIHRPPFT